MKRILIVLVAMGVLLGTVYGAAAALNVNTSTLAAGDGTVSSCDTDGVELQWYTHMTDNSNPPDHLDGGVWVDKVKVWDICADCDGKFAHISIRSNGNHVQMCREEIASGEAVMDGVSMSGVLDCLNNVTVWADEVDGVRVVIKDIADW